ncbi:MAG: YafY family protein [Verrucomicrobiota bacterium]
MNRIERLTGMILLLQSQRVITAEQIAAHYEISVRTVYRDLAALGEAGVPIAAEAGVGYTLMKGYHMPPVMFTEEEAAALFLSGKITGQVADESLRRALEEALLKIRSILPAERSDYLARLQQSTSVWSCTPHSPERLPELMAMQEAVVRRRCIAIQYDAASRGELTIRTIEPVGLVFYGGHWHLIAFCRLRKEFRDFRIDRLRRWEVLPETYHGHTDFSLETFLHNAIRTQELTPAIVIVQKKVIERFRSELFCMPIREELLPNGSLRVEILVFSIPWFAGWLLSFGPAIEVEEPPPLRLHLRDAALAVLALYSTTPENECVHPDIGLSVAFDLIHPAAAIPADGKPTINVLSK